jgi:hypothetical protein
VQHGELLDWYQHQAKGNAHFGCAMINDISLNAEQRERLNSVLDGCFWDACFVDEKARIGVSAVELIGVHFEDQRLGDAYPATLVCYPVQRVAASYQVDGEVRPLRISDINSALQEFSFREIDDWDLVDPPPEKQFLWRERLSLDARLGEDSKDWHILEMWQDDSPFQTFNLSLWFQRIFLFDAKLNQLTLLDLEAARERGNQAADRGWLRIGAVPPLSVDALLARISV